MNIKREKFIQYWKIGAVCYFLLTLCALWNAQTFEWMFLLFPVGMVVDLLGVKQFMLRETMFAPSFIVEPTRKNSGLRQFLFGSHIMLLLFWSTGLHVLSR